MLAVQPNSIQLGSTPLPLPIATTVALGLGVLSLAIPKMLPKNSQSAELTAILIGLALAESLAIIGFVRVFSSGEGLQAFWPFLLGSAALYVVHRPK